MKEYTYNIINIVYEWMLSRKKDIEVRTLKEKSELIQVGDFITFNNLDISGQYIKVKVVGKTIFNNLSELLNNFNVERMMPGHTVDELKELMNKIYADELLTKKIVAFEFEYLSSDKDSKIIEYEDKYEDDIKDLLVELEEYIISIDKDNLDRLHPEYRDKMALLDLNKVNENNGKCYIYVENSKAIGLIMGFVKTYEEYDYLDYKCPKSGEILELIVTKKARNKGIGQLLINKMEYYFKNIGCNYVFVDVFAYNEKGMNFYNNEGYHSRMDIMIKKI